MELHDYRHLKITMGLGRELQVLVSKYDLDVVLFLVIESEASGGVGEFIEACGNPQSRELFTVVVLDEQTNEIRKALVAPGELEYRTGDLGEGQVERPVPHVVVGRRYGGCSYAYTPEEVMRRMKVAREEMAMIRRSMGKEL